MRAVILRTIRIAFRAIVSNKMRSFLTMLGIIIGVMSVVILVSIGQGARSSITDSIASMGTNLLTANITDEDVSVSEEDLSALADYGSIVAIAPVVTSSQTVKGEGSTHSTSVVGVTETYGEVQQLSVQSGRMMLSSDLIWRTPVCIVGTDVATEVFDTWDVIGKELVIGDRTFTIVGLLEETGSTTFGSGDDRVLIPLTTAQRLTGQTGITQFYAAATSESEVARAENLIDAFLLSHTRDEDAYTVYNQSEMLETMDDVTDTLSLMLAGIAAISLLVGGIGIMNIMLVSVAERTREIGIRKAVGAKRRHILGQFLVEACALSIVGGLIGILLSVLGIEIFNLIGGMSIRVSYGIAMAAIGFCAVIGITFGGYPAAKASKLLPIEALRYS